jgi:hypothetical protein
MAEMDRRAGRPAVTPEVVASNLGSMISLNEKLIRYAQASRAGITGIS